MKRQHTPKITTDLISCESPNTELMHEVMCAQCGRCGRDNKFLREDLEMFTAGVLEAHGAPREEALTTARVLVQADSRGISSHGIARLGRYLKGIEAGYIRPGVEMRTFSPTEALGVIDAHHGLGQVAGEQAMELAIAKAKKTGVGVVTVRNSNHYGIAGYYVQKALEHGMAAFSMTNSAPLVIPTNGAEALLGTNPIAFGIPADKQRPVLVDMATSVVPRGKLEVYDRNRQQMPVGWAVDEFGYDAQNPGRILQNLLERAGGGILPLGGRTEEFGGHKGYGLALMVDMLCGVLSGSAFGSDVNNLNRTDLPQGEIQAPRVGHFFLALDVERFMPASELRSRVDAYVEMLKSSKVALDREMIFVHGEKEQVRAELHEKDGIPIADNVLNALRQIAEKSKVKPPVTLAQRQH